MKFATEHPKLTTMISIAVIVLSAMTNILYLVFVPLLSQGDPEKFVPTSAIYSPTVQTPPPTEPSDSPYTMITMGILMLMVLMIIIIIFSVLKYLGAQRKKRDKQRRQDLKLIAQGLEAYKQIHGTYPLSTTFQPEYYTAINLSNDWNYYGLPGKEHMANFVPGWPVSDPSINYMSKVQVNQYLYYPKEKGQKFFLYAHLEEPGKDERNNYNKEDNLLLSWGAYNYRIASGQEQPALVNDVHPHKAPSPTPAPSGFTSPPAAVQPSPAQVQPSIASQPIQAPVAQMQSPSIPQQPVDQLNYSTPPSPAAANLAPTVEYEVPFIKNNQPFNQPEPVATSTVPTQHTQASPQQVVADNSPISQIPVATPPLQTPEGLSGDPQNSPPNPQDLSKPTSS